MSYDISPAEEMNVEFYPTFAPIEVEPTLDPRDTMTRQAERQLAASQGSFVLRPDFMATHGLGDYLMRSSSFTPNEEWSEGRRDSEQVVTFGELEIVVDNDDVVTVPVAAKPYLEQDRPLAVHEYAALGDLHANPELKTFDPIGFWVTESGNPVLLTVFEETVTSLDNADWAQTGDPSLLGQYDLTAALQKTAQLLARLHMNGRAHQDTDIKNLAVDTATDQLRIIDLPRLIIIDGSSEGDELLWRQHVADDLTTLVASVRRRGYMADVDPDMAREAIKHTLLEPHRALLRHPGNSFRLGSFALESLDTIAQDILEAV